MTESEWLVCTEPEMMLRYLRGRGTSGRKWRLFAIGCCRHIWHLFKDERSRRAVETSEHYVEGLADEAELERAYAEAVVAEEEAFAAGFTENGDDGRDWPARRAATAVAANPLLPFQVASQASTACVWAVRGLLGEMQRVKARENGFQCNLLRDLFGNPFSPVLIDPTWLSWHAGTVVAQAQMIYAQERFTELPLLGETLEAAGCTEANILAHCRQQGEHRRGCWVVDLLLDNRSLPAATLARKGELP
jgi:hypothetical protein